MPKVPEDPGRSDCRRSKNPEKSKARWKINDKLWMKDSEGRHTTLVWVVGREYNEDRGGWDYKLRQKDSADAWLDGHYLIAETELKRA